jgi:hypothetical protein
MSNVYVAVNSRDKALVVEISGITNAHAVTVSQAGDRGRP